MDEKGNYEKELKRSKEGDIASTEQKNFSSISLEKFNSLADYYSIKDM